VSPMKYELGFYIPEDAILHNHRRENLKSYTGLFLFDVILMTDFGLYRKNIIRVTDDLSRRAQLFAVI
jgi:hypothetical protein